MVIGGKQEPKGFPGYHGVAEGGEIWLTLCDWAKIEDGVDWDTWDLELAWIPPKGRGGLASFLWAWKKWWRQIECWKNLRVPATMLGCPVK